jgi:hypothetical protein
MTCRDCGCDTEPPTVLCVPCTGLLADRLEKMRNNWAKVIMNKRVCRACGGDTGADGFVYCEPCAIDRMMIRK